MKKESGFGVHIIMAVGKPPEPIKDDKIGEVDTPAGGIKIRGTGAATKGLKARGPMA